MKRLILILLFISFSTVASGAENGADTIREKSAQKACFMLVMEKGKAKKAINSSTPKDQYISDSISSDPMLKPAKNQTEGTKIYFKRTKEFQSAFYDIAYDLASDKLNAEQAKEKRI